MIDWKTDGMDDFDRTFRRYRQVSSKSFEAAVKHRAMTLAWELFKEAQKVGRRAARKIKALPDHVFRSRDGKAGLRGSRDQRLQRTGYHATGWLAAALRVTPTARRRVKPLNPVRSREGRAELKLGGLGVRSITIVNATRQAAKVDADHQITAKAIKRQTADMQKYLDRKAAENIRRSGF